MDQAQARKRSKLIFILCSNYNVCKGFYITSKLNQLHIFSNSFSLESSSENCYVVLYLFVKWYMVCCSMMRYLIVYTKSTFDKANRVLCHHYLDRCQIDDKLTCYDTSPKNTSEPHYLVDYDNVCTCIIHRVV